MGINLQRQRLNLNHNVIKSVVQVKQFIFIFIILEDAVCCVVKFFISYCSMIASSIFMWNDMRL